MLSREYSAQALHLIRGQVSRYLTPNLTTIYLGAEIDRLNPILELTPLDRTRGGLRLGGDILSG